MRQRKHSRPNPSRGQRPKNSAVSAAQALRYRRQKLTRITIGIIVLVLISFVGMSYTNKLSGTLPTAESKAPKAPAPTQPAR